MEIWKTSSATVALALQKPMGLHRCSDALRVAAGEDWRLSQGRPHGRHDRRDHLRSTRIRSLTHTMIAVPNSLLVSRPIDNILARQSILFHQFTRLRHGTTADRVEQVLAGTRQLLAAAARRDQASPRARLKAFGEVAMESEVFAYLVTVDFAEFLSIAEEPNPAVARIVHQALAELARPLGAVSDSS